MPPNSYLHCLPFESAKEFTVCHFYWFNLYNGNAIFVNLFEISDGEIWQLCIDCSPSVSLKSPHILDTGCNSRASVIISRKQSSAGELTIGTQPDKWHNTKPHVWNSASELWAGANYITSNTRTQERIATVKITWRLASKQKLSAAHWTQKTKAFGLAFFLCLH